MKSKEYYERAANKYNSKAYVKLGNIYYYGLGVEKDYLTAKYYYDLASQESQIEAVFYLGELYSNGSFFDIDLPKSIEHFSYCIKYRRINKYNKYCYFSYNDHGLIYLILYQNIEKSKELIKEAAFGEYPFAQNNYGLMYQFYFNNIGEAEHFYERSSQNKFSLACFNLGHLSETENKIDESIYFYLEAIKYEDEPLIFKKVHRHDKQLEVSKSFIICFVNLKLIGYYFSKSKFAESKKYFIKLISRLKEEDEYYVSNFIAQGRS